MRRRAKRPAGQLYDPNILLQKTILRIREAAELLDVAPRTVQRYLTEGKLTPAFTPGGQRRVPVDQVRPYLVIR